MECQTKYSSFGQRGLYEGEFKKRTHFHLTRPVVSCFIFQNMLLGSCLKIYTYIYSTRLYTGFYSGSLALFLSRSCYGRLTDIVFRAECFPSLFISEKQTVLVLPLTSTQGVLTHPAHGHLIGRKRSSLVGADDRGAAQGLHRGQRAHNGVLLGHAACSQSQTGGDDGGKTLGDGGDGQGHGDLEVVDGAAEPGAAVHGVAEVADVDEPNRNADERDDFGELLTELVQLLLQRRLLLLRARHLVTDLADLGGDAGADHDADGTACGDVGALNKKVRTGSEPILVSFPFPHAQLKNTNIAFATT